MPSIFISHSTQDNEKTRRIANSLKQAGLDVWVDFESIRDGTRWSHEIQTGIDSCDAVIVVLSKASRQSEWVEKECLYAFGLRKPVFIALIEDVHLPLHLVNIQYTDCREQITDGVNNLIKTLQQHINASSISDDHIEDDASIEATEDNFFPYVEQLPRGETAMWVAKDLYHWAQQVADVIDFGGQYNPNYHVKIDLNDRQATVFSIWAYPQTPSTQIPLDYLSDFKPYTRASARVALLKKLNQLLPDEIQFDEGKVNRRPTIPLHYLSTAEKLEGFKQIVGEIIVQLRSG